MHSQENVRLLEDSLSESKTSSKVIRNICSSFNEVVYPAETILILDNEPLKYLYLIKEGTCDIFSTSIHPLDINKKKTPFTTIKATGGQVALGLD